MVNPLITVPEVAERLRIPVRTAYAMLDEGGAMGALRINIGPKLVRVDPMQLEVWLANQARGAAHVSR
jgi:excisionase family DNA binding protein